MNHYIALFLIFIGLVIANEDMLQSCRSRSRNLHGETFDYVILGGGTAGSVLANRLSKNRRNSVLVLEAGPSINQTDARTETPSFFGLTFGSSINWNYLTVPQPKANNNRIYMSRIKGLGGCSKGNANIYNRGPRSDYDGWAADTNDQTWGWSSMLNIFRQSENNTRQTYYHGNRGEWQISDANYVHAATTKMISAAMEFGDEYSMDHSNGDPNGITINQVSIVNGVRNSIDKAFLSNIVDRPNLYIKPDAMVKKIIFNRNRAVAVEFKDIANGNIIKRVNIGKEVIVAAGTIGSPQLLLVSGVGPANELVQHNITVVKDLPKVGKELHDHIILGVSARVKDLETFDENSINPTKYEEYKNKKTGPFASNLPEMTGMYKSHLSERFFCNNPDMQYITAPVLYVKQGAVQQQGNYSITFGVSLATPFSRGEIKLASADSEVAPLINPNYLADERDTSRLVEFVKRAIAILGMPSIRYNIMDITFPPNKAMTDEEIEEYVREYIVSGNHPVGSCRMGTNERNSVVDNNLKVHGLENVRVVDASIMPTIIKTNPMATVVAIAEVAAKKILQ
jgi:choline dehydrogenase